MTSGFEASVFQRMPAVSNISSKQAPETSPAPTLEEAAVSDHVSRVLAGDSEAFRSLVEAHEKAVYGLCRRLLYGNDTEAEDLTQETFVRAYEHLDRLEDRARFAPWLFQIARSLCRDRRRRLRIEGKAIEVRLSELREAQRHAERDDGDLDLPVESALDDLPEDERQILSLRYFSGLSYDEIGGKLALSFSQVDHLIRKARSRLSRRVQVLRRREAAAREV